MICPFNCRSMSRSISRLPKPTRRSADRAVVAIENARLLNELRQRTNDLSQRTNNLSKALEQQTATFAGSRFDRRRRFGEATRKQSRLFGASV